MKLFKCQSCGQLLYFENTRCERCAHRLGYLPQAFTVSAVEPARERWKALADPARQFRFCDNAGYEACNWLIESDVAGSLCAACRHNHTVPDLSIADNLALWRLLELNKHRLFYTLLRLRLPLVTRIDDPKHGLAFDFLAESPSPTGPKVLTGRRRQWPNHYMRWKKLTMRSTSNRRRTEMGEPYRSLLGHFPPRSFGCHYFWDVLVRDGGRLNECRAVFGDDSMDYGDALQAHYQNGAPAGLAGSLCQRLRDHSSLGVIGPRPGAHYLHIVDTLEMASAFGIRVQPRVVRDEALVDRN